MKNNNDKLLDQEIEEKFNDESAEHPKIKQSKEHGKAAQVTIALLLAAIVLLGIFLPIFF